MKIIVIGGSAGSIKSVKKITSALKKDIDAAVFVVIHFPPDKTSFLPDIINTDSALTAMHAHNDQKIEAGMIYVAVPDYHLVINKGRMHLGSGPKENRFRPAIDVLFRSAALEYGSRVTGVVLSGLLDDGTAGLNAIKERNGTAIVQEPADAEFSSMPMSALRQVAVDYCVPAAEIGPLLSNVINLELKSLNTEKEDMLEWENSLANGANNDFDTIMKFASSTRYICPDCEGPLFRIKDDKIKRYRCFTGHAFTAATLLQDIREKLEHLLWTTYRTMDEQKEMIETDPDQSEELAKEREKLIQQLETIKKLL